MQIKFRGINGKKKDNNTTLYDIWKNHNQTRSLLVYFYSTVLYTPLGYLLGAYKRHNTKNCVIHQSVLGGSEIKLL